MNKKTGYISILIVSAVIVLTCWQSFTVIHFYANQEEIAAEFCENIDRPELKCLGQCHLKKQLENTIDTDSKVKTFHSSLLIFQAFEKADEIKIVGIDNTAKTVVSHLTNISDGISSALLDPPQTIS